MRDSACRWFIVKKAKIEVMFNIFEFSRVWENIESWLVYANKPFWIVQPYFLTNIIKQSSSQLLVLAFKTFNRYNLLKLKKSNCFIYIGIAKHRWVIKLEEFKSDQKCFAREIRKSWKPRKIIPTVRKLFN